MSGAAGKNIILLHHTAVNHHYFNAGESEDIQCFQFTTYQLRKELGFQIHELMTSGHVAFLKHRGQTTHCTPVQSDICSNDTTPKSLRKSRLLSKSYNTRPWASEQSSYSKDNGKQDIPYSIDMSVVCLIVQKGE